MPSLKLKLHQSSLSLTQLTHRLTDLGYQRESICFERGEFSVRGGIVDIFPFNQTHPVRIEYDGDTIDRLNAFNPHDQRSLSVLDQTTVSAVQTTPVKVQAPPKEPPIHHRALSTVLGWENGSYVVHETYGIGRYMGLKRLVTPRYEGEYIYIQYRGSDKLYVPLDQLHLVQPYSGSHTTPRLTPLSDGSWERAKKKAQTASLVFAKEIYETAKNRQKTSGYAFSPDTEFQIEMERQFPFQETEDQLKAIQQVKSDMESPHPMDRLLCGDVGYGKTEVIMRAAFKAAMDHKQVAVLVPTTILAQQHADTFKARMAALGVEIGLLSRFKSRSQQAETIKRLANHRIDIVIGTHRLLQKDVKFADLGLLIVDEEQRFGVTHKEKLKKLRLSVDILSVTATPIPRTLYMAISGARDLSRLQSPPQSRKPVITIIEPFNQDRLIQAVTHEISRKGQVFYVFNRIEQLAKKHRMLANLFPTLKISVAHGQMKPAELEKLMWAFKQHQTDLLLCTTIIENGIDIPNANTIILDGAGQLGLSQIYQLRGRVGRTETQAYCYGFHAPQAVLSSRANERLEAVQEYTALGSGYRLAMRDLEIRGAGTLLGERQHGHMTAIGFDLYCKLLTESVAHLKGAPLQTRHSHFKIPAHLKAIIPADYIPDESVRLSIYKRLSGVQSRDEVDHLVAELRDRFGPLPDLVATLFDTIRYQCP